MIRTRSMKSGSMNPRRALALGLAAAFLAATPLAAQDAAPASAEAPESPEASEAPKASEAPAAEPEDAAGGPELFVSGYVKGAGYWAWAATKPETVFPFAGSVAKVRLEADFAEAGIIVAATEAMVDLGHVLVEGSDSSSAAQYYPLGFRYNVQDRLAAELDIKELYYENAWGDLALRVGKQIVVWGQADGSNPTDILNARHIGTRTGASTDESRMGLLGLDLNWYLPDGKSKIEAVFMPWATVNDLPLPVLRTRVVQGAGFAPNVDVELAAAQKPEFGVSSMEGAFRGLFETGDWTWSLSAFCLIDRFPDIKATSYTVAGNPPITPNTVVNVQTPVYKRIQAYGADFATSIAGFDLRGEGLLTITEDLDGTDLYVKNPHVSAVLQLGRTWLDGTLSTGLTWGPRYVINHKAWDSYGSTLKDAAKQIYAQNGQGFEWEHAIGLRTELKAMNETLTLTGFGLYNIMARDWLGQASVGYNLADGLNLKAGVNLYGSLREDSDILRSFGTFGSDSARDRDNIFAELVWSF